MWTEWELLSRLLNFGMYSFLFSHWWDCLPSSSVSSYPLMIFCSAGLVVMNLLNLFWFWIVFISPLILRDNFPKNEDLHYQLLTSRLWRMLFHAFLSVSDERYYLVLSSISRVWVGIFPYAFYYGSLDLQLWYIACSIMYRIIFPEHVCAYKCLLHLNTNLFL